MDPSFVLEGDPGRRTLVVTGLWSKTAESVLRSGEADGLIVNYARGCRERDLEFLDDWPVRRLLVLARTFTDVSPIYRLSATLEELQIEMAEHRPVDLSLLPNLATLRADWNVMEGSFSESVHLEELLVWGYDRIDLTALSRNPELRVLVLKGAPVLEGLRGIEDLQSLNILEVLRAARLESLRDLIGASTGLRELMLEACPHVGNIGGVGRLTRLRRIGLNDCGRLDTLAPISKLTELEVVHAWGSTQVADADLSPLDSLPLLTELRMRDRPEYRPPLKEVKMRIEGRRHR